MAVSSPNTQTNKNSSLSSHQKKTRHRSSPKRMKSPAIHIGGVSTQDSDGKTCHQCRQKISGLAASCKNVRHKRCTIKICRKCLLNRYGEKAEEIAKLDDWKCPKCRGVCNCSICMKKRGHQPTGALTQAAKETGFSSVLEMLQLKGKESLAIEKAVTDLHSSPNKLTVTSKVLITSKRKHGKENSSFDPNMQHKPLPSNGGVKLKAEIGRKKVKINDGKGNACIGSGKGAGLKKKNDLQAWIHEKIHASPIAKDEKVNGSDGVLLAGGEIKVPNGETTPGAVVKSVLLPENFKLKKHAMGSHSKDVDADVVLPQGHDLVTVGGVDLPADDVGPALQFLEFCTAFRQVLDLKKGQPEAILRELTRGRVGRGGLYSAIVQFHIKLLSFMQKDFGEESLSESMSTGSSWFQALGKCISESQFGSKQFSLDYFNRGVDGYSRLDSSEKLRVLNFLCDEILGTEQLRNWIDKENLKYVEGMKEAKAKVLAAKEKEKLVKQKVKDEMEQALLSSRNGALSVVEHENIVSKMKIETEKAHAEMLEAMAMAPKKKQMLDAVRTEPILLDGGGRIYWRLRSYCDKSCFILQDIGKWDLITPQDKWFIYDEDQQNAVEEYISTLRKKHRTVTSPNTAAFGSNDVKFKA
ncbi:uncharacterized protein LOC131237579 isoform X2 [Magnolia sinica]|uniref:uncharacterized protein LOC131237579 isoform X2 n=1 Tax=Magnolia sinica TaxID=86752 RepID=UPI00265B2EB5|nr:uncharacterized protein LOC131237579 isoform X2 [Magnolia sinica]